MTDKPAYWARLRSILPQVSAFFWTWNVELLILDLHAQKFCAQVVPLMQKKLLKKIYGKRKYQEETRKKYISFHIRGVHSSCISASLHYDDKMANTNRPMGAIQIWMVQCTCPFRCCNSYLLLLLRRARGLQLQA